MVKIFQHGHYRILLSKHQFKTSLPWSQMFGSTFSRSISVSSSTCKHTKMFTDNYKMACSCKHLPLIHQPLLLCFFWLEFFPFKFPNFVQSSPYIIQLSSTEFPKIWSSTYCLHYLTVFNRFSPKTLTSTFSFLDLIFFSPISSESQFRTSFKLLIFKNLLHFFKTTSFSFFQNFLFYPLFTSNFILTSSFQPC